MKLTEAVERAKEFIESERPFDSGPDWLLIDAVKTLVDALTIRVPNGDGTEMVFGVPEHMTPLDWNLHLPRMQLLGTDGDKLRLSFPKAEVILRVVCVFPNSAMNVAPTEGATE